MRVMMIPFDVKYRCAKIRPGMPKKQAKKMQNICASASMAAHRDWAVDNNPQVATTGSTGACDVCELNYSDFAAEVSAWC